MKKSLLPAKHLAASRKRSLETDDLVKILERYFGYSEFRGKQLEAIEAVLSGRDCFCLMPTGGGKSMCYQIPALAKPGIVLVISPLIALMENQVAALKSKGIKAEFLSSTQTTHIKEKIHEDLDSGKPYIKLLYVTPELVATFGFAAKLTKLHNRGLISLIAIDEAHCISSWGHDFRPSYRKLSSLRKQLTGVPILALTATAVPKVQNDVIKSLCLHDPVILLSSFNRPNIFYEVRYKDLIKDAYSDITSLLNSSGNVCSIIYCLERSTCDDLSLHLSSQGISSAAYHAGLNSKLRTSVLDDWLSSKIQVVVATVAFGMGIDRKDVRIVMHYNMPKSMESFYQESGRAGRDQFASKSVLYYGLDDRRKMEFIIRNSGNKKKNQSSDNNDAVFAKKGLNDFNQIVEYCEGSGCRRKKILESFGEHVSPLLCKKTCDSCKHPNLVSQSLDELTRMSTRHSGFQPVIMKNWSTNSTLEKETEFWNREDDLSGSDEDISNSDDEGEEVSRVNLSKISSKAGMNEKFKALERAEEAYYRNKNPYKQGGGLADNKIISETLRDSCNKRLLSSLNAAKQRLGNLPFNMDESAAFLETECFKKYEKVGRSFYNSQMAATIRWLSSCTYQQMHDRLQPNFVKITTESNTINTASPSDKKPAVASTELNQQAFELESSSLISVQKIELPPIPSFSQFVSRKGKEKMRSSQHSEHGSKRIQESKGPNGSKHKKMK